MFIIVLIVHLFLVVPIGFLDTLLSLTSVSKLPSEFVLGLSDSYEVFKSQPILGIGRGEGAFLIASGGASPEFNLLLGIATLSGAPVLILFVLMTMLFFRQGSFYRAYFSGSRVKTTGRMAFLSIFCLLVYGAGADIFSDPSIVYLFFSTFGIGSAILLRTKKESDERMEYYGDSASIDTSMLDIGLN